MKIKFYEILGLETRHYDAGGGGTCDTEEEAVNYLKSILGWSGYETAMENVKSLQDIQKLFDNCVIDNINIKYYPLTLEIELEIEPTTGKVLNKSVTTWFV